MADQRVNRRMVLAARPVGLPADSDFEFIEQVVEPLAPGMVLVEVNTLSIDAFIRTVLDEGSYHQSVKLGGTVTALGVGCVLESTVAQLVPGDHVFGPLGAQTFATLAATTLRGVTSTLSTFGGSAGNAISSPTCKPGTCKVAVR